MEPVFIEGVPFGGVSMSTEHAVLLAIKAAHGFVGCGYFDIETADKLGDRVAIVTGVSTFEEMLDAKVVKVSQAALDAGVQTGISGREALMIFHA